MSGPTRIALACLLLAIFCGARADDSYANTFSIAIRTFGSGATADQRTLEERRPTVFDSADRSPRSAPAESFVLASRSNEISAKWAELQSRISADEATLGACRSGDGTCPAAARRFLSLIELGQQQQGRARLGVINRAVIETMRSGAGDCEDYAIAKYVALRQAGLAPADLRVIIVYDAKHGTNHAVVAVHHDGEWLVLDNRTFIMVNAEAIQNYWPLFVLDHRGVAAMATAFLLR